MSSNTGSYIPPVINKSGKMRPGNEMRPENEVPAAASNSSESAAETADPPNIKSRLILVQEQEGKNGEQKKYIATVVKKETSMSGQSTTQNKGPANQGLMTSGGRRKRSHRKRSHKRTHKSHKSHKSHKRIHR